MAGLLTAGQCAAKSSVAAPDAKLSYRARRGTSVPRKTRCPPFCAAGPAPPAGSAASLPSRYLSAMLGGPAPGGAALVVGGLEGQGGKAHKDAAARGGEGAVQAQAGD